MKCTFCGSGDDGRVVMTFISDGDEIVCAVCLRKAIQLLAEEVDPEDAVRRVVQDIIRKGPTRRGSA